MPETRKKQTRRTTVVPKKPAVIFLADAKFSNSPKKLAARLTEILPTNRYIVRLKSRPALAPTPRRKLFTWGQNLNKLRQYEAFRQNNIPHPEWTTDINVAEQWHRDGHTVLGRTLINSFGGKGINVFDEESGFNRNINCKVYTKYKKKKHEFRIHVFNGNVIDFAQKKKRTEANRADAINTKIRNFKNGWVYCREGIALNPAIATLAISALRSVGHTYGAVDIIWNEYENQAYVLEINTAPGLAGSTINSYAEAFRNHLSPPAVFR